MRKKYKDAVMAENGRMNELSPVVVAVLACCAPRADESRVLITEEWIT